MALQKALQVASWWASRPQQLIVSWQNFKFCATTVVRNLNDKFTWRLIVVYGSPDEEHKLYFLVELDLVMNAS
jgi:hypothetical protein